MAIERARMAPGAWHAWTSVTPPASDFATFTRAVELMEQDGALRCEPLMNQLGWTEPSGVQLLLETTVRGEAFAVTSTVALRVADASSGGGGAFGR